MLAFSQFCDFSYTEGQSWLLLLPAFFWIGAMLHLLPTTQSLQLLLIMAVLLLLGIIVLLLWYSTVTAQTQCK